MKIPASRNTDDGISELVSEVLIIALVVILAGVVGAVMLGYISLPQKSTSTAFSVTVVTDGSGKPVAISLVPVAGDSLTASKGGSAPVAGQIISNMTIHLIDPSGAQNTTVLCASMPSKMQFQPGVPMYIFKRTQNVYYMANSTSAGACGGGSGGGTPTNQPFTLHGNWRIIVADTLNSNTVVYDGFVRI